MSSYLILYTINPDFVTSTVNLPGLGTTTPDTATGEAPGTYPTPGPSDPKLPNKLAVVQKVATDNPNLILKGCDGTLDAKPDIDFVAKVVEALRASDSRFGFNGKRGSSTDLSRDAISYYWGQGLQRTDLNKFM